MRLFRALGVAATVLTLALACCSQDDGGGGGGEGFNDADVDFASDMIQHHAQALEMVDLTMERDLDPEVVKLTEGIRAARAPEIETMSEWLQEWGEPVPETSRDHANAHGDGSDGVEMDEDMPGMMSAEDMTMLEDAPDAEFQDLWLEMMIGHHRGAVEMAQEETEEGESAEAIALAEDIVAAQEKEVATMEDLLQG